MSRTRKITTDDVLDAAERVIGRYGAVGLSIDAVATEAGISKTRVVYDYKSKAALLEALMKRCFERETERVRIAVEECADTEHPEFFGRLRVAERAPTDLEKLVAIAITTAAPLEKAVQRQIQEWTDKDLEAMAKGGAKPYAARMAYLALHGLCTIEWLGMHEWPQKQRRSILDGVRTIYETFHEPIMKQ